MDVCEIKMPSNGVTKELKNHTGFNKIHDSSIILQTFNEDSFTDEFIDWYQKKYKTDKVPNVNPKNASEAKKLASDVIDFYYILNPSVSYTSRTDIYDKSAEFGYTSTLERSKGKEHVATFILKEFELVNRNNTNIGDDKLQYYLNAAKKAWIKHIISIGAKRTNKSTSELTKEYNESKDKASFIETLLGGKIKTISDANIFAVYKELFSSKENAILYLNEVLANNRTSDVLHEIDNELEKELYAINDAGNDVKSDTSDVNLDTSDDIYDVSISIYNNHTGVYTSYMAHVGQRIRNYFNTLSKLNSPKVNDFDTNNTYGIPETMNANECVSMLYNSSIFTNIPEMIKGIKEIGERVKGFESFVQFAKDLENNYDFATEVFTVFAKTKMQKLETIYEDGKVINRISNNEADPYYVFLNDLYNDLKSTSINEFGLAPIEEKLSKLTKSFRPIESFIKDIEDEEGEVLAKAEISKLKSDIVSLVKTFFPSISDKAIVAYIELHNNNKENDLLRELTNIGNLVTDIKGIVETVPSATKAYNEMLAKAEAIKEHNKSLAKAERTHFVDRREYISLKEIYSDDYVKVHTTNVKSIISKLLRYSIINTDLNSRNIHGNNNSNIINNSMLTGYKKMLDSTYIDENGNLRNDALEAWGIEKLKSPQYKYSNLLLEQYDENGNIINEGKAIFKYVNGQLCLTKNATNLLSLELFQGSSNIDDGVNLSYAEMNEGDYLPTAYINFFKTRGFNIPKDSAEYFLRIPSDAPKTFTLRAPKHDTTGLFKIKDIDKYNDNVTYSINNFTKIITKSEFKEKYAAPIVNGKQNVQVVKASDLSRILFKNESYYVSNYYALKEIPDTKREDGSYDAYLTLRVGDVKNNIAENDVIILKGTIVPAGKGRKIINYTVEATFDANSEKREIPYNVSRAIEGHFSERLLTEDVTIGGKTLTKAEKIVDVKHPVFNMLKNQFKQELLDGANAIAHYFELEQAKDGTYYVRLDKNNRPIFKENRSNTKGYRFYHLDENGKVVTFGKNKYTLGGKVFHSNKFTCIIEKNGKIIEKNYLDEVITHDTLYKDDGSINFLYGGAMKLVVENGKVTDVILNDKQNNKVNDALSDFINEYQRQAEEEIQDKSEFIHGVPTNSAAVTEFAINQLLMAFTFDEMFEGNTKFYKDSQTILKRAKEVQGSGIPYGIADYSKDFVPSLEDVEKSYLNNGEIIEYELVTVRDKNGRVTKKIKKDANGKPVLKTTSIQSLFANSEFGEIRQRKGFKGVTVKNSTRTNTNTLNELVQKLVKLGVDENHAMDMLFGFPKRDKNGKIITDENGVIQRKGGFTETTVNDAQSYITFDEWVRRIAARGQLQKYLPLIRKVLDRSKPLNAEDISEFIQVQKNFYYDLYYDKNYGIYIPRQIKNAEFVLVPRFIEGTQLEEVYKAMKKAGIDQLNTAETSKAANEEILTLWDNEGNLTQESIDNFVSNSQNTSQIFSYNNLYTQQETPQHMKSENKASVQIVKKMYDNISEDSDIYYLKKEFYKLYTENIAESAKDLLEEFEIPIDENGNIITDDKGNIQGLNLKVFLNKLKNEILRRGANSNTLDYVTIEKGNSLPNMPAALMNNVLTMFESVSQSLFNNNITRQTLPGFHAAQITNIGWKAFATGKENVSYSKELEYHPTQWINKENEEDIISNREYNKLSPEDKKKYKKGEPASYIEVMVPYSALGINKNDPHYKNMSDEDILKELAEEKLNEFIGYRIPTEGKQSIAVMRVVGFIDTAYGSTIVVPDNWVSQTGSDFDIDSVYGITCETYKTHDGQIKRIAFKDKLDKYDWFRYISDLDTKSIDENTKGAIKEAKEKVKKLNKEIEVELQKKEDEAYNGLLEGDKKALVNLNKTIDTKITKKSLKGRDAYYFRLKEISNFVDSQLQAIHAEKRPKRLIDFKESIDNIINNIEQYSQNYNDATKKEIDKILDAKIKAYNEVAKKAGLLTLEEYINPDNKYRANSRKARNTRIFENMKEVLQSDESFEENISRSNFDNIIVDRNASMSENDINARKYRSPYNFFHQAKYQEDAMSGAKLKAFSVTLDTFCSICNTVKPTLSVPIRVVHNSSIAENNKNLSDRFGKDNVKQEGENIIITYDKYGWSNDNRSVDNYILTAYSSQTTAFILDAIKEGAIPNVNDYSFAVFKTLANLGINYRTSIPFIMQPGVSRIVNAYKANKSVFSNRKGNPIHQAIREMAIELGIKDADKNPIVAILNSINKQYGKDFNKIFKQEGDEDIVISINQEKTKDIPILADKLIDRLKNEGMFKNSSPVEELLFDLGVILTYSNINNTSNEIGNITRCLNPDKFGAKQTVFATRKVFEKLNECMFQIENVSGVKVPKKPILDVNGKHILAAIYPGIDNVNYTVNDIINHIIKSNDIHESKYPTLMAFLKYATATSVVVAKTLFDTQSDSFVKLVDDLKYRFNGYNVELSEDRYNDFQKYILSSIYNNCPSITYPLSVRDNNGNIGINYSSGKDMSIADNYDSDAILEETKRIYGYEHDASLIIRSYETLVNPDGTPILTESGRKRVKTILTPFKVQNINNPSNEEIEQFEKLSPAQKITFIKQNFSDKGIFEFIDVSLYNASVKGKFVGMQTLSYKEQNVGENVIYAEFRKAFYNKNPLIVSAAIDIVKYAVQVEGFRMTARAVNKVIDNDCLINEFGSNGLGFVDYIRSEMTNIESRKSQFSEPLKREELYENYLRSHKDISEIRTIYLTKSNINKYGLKKGYQGTYYFKKGDNEKEFNDNLESMGIKTYLSNSDKYITNKYIRLKDKSDNTLYKIKDGIDYIILYPLSNLESNENRQWSCNESNNSGVLSKEVYEQLCDDFASVATEQDFNRQFILGRIDEYKTNKVFASLRYKNRKNVNKLIPADESFNLEESAREGGAFSILKDIVINHFDNLTADRLFVNNIGLSKHIFSPGVEFGTTQKIKDNSNKDRTFRIFIPDFIDKIEKDYLQAENKADASNIGNKSLENIIRNAQEQNVKYLSNTFEVVEVTNIDEISDDMALANSMEEANLGVLDFAAARANIEKDNSSSNLLSSFYNKGIKRNIHDLKENKSVVIREIAKYAKDSATYIKEELFDRFVKNLDMPDRHFSILSNEALALTKDSAVLLDKMFKAVNLSNAFRDTFEFYRDFNVESEDADIQRYINDIKSSLDVINKLPISDVRRKACEIIASNESTNPLIKEDIIDIFDGFWKTNGVMWAIHDIMENGTPILQIMLKNITSDIEAKQKMSNHVIKKFRDKVNEIINKAKNNGRNVDIKKLVNENGEFVQDYDSSLAEEVEKLNKAVKTSIDKYGYGSEQHIEAKIRWDEFKSKYFNQEAAPEYYITRVANDKKMFENYPKLFSAYMTLFYERLSIYNYVSKHGFDDEHKRKLADIEERIYNLHRPDVYKVGDTFVERPHQNDNVSKEDLDFYGASAANMLANYIKKTKELNNEYFEYDSVYGFQEQLEYNLSVVEDLEQRDRDGNPTIPQSVLEQNPKYIEARDWLLKNARFAVNTQTDKYGNPISLGGMIKSAFEKLGLAGNGKIKKANKIAKDHNNGEGIYDSANIPDARKLNDQEIADIKQTQQDILYGTLPEGTDRILISNTFPNQDIYSKTFYDRMKVRGTSNEKYFKIVTKLNKILFKYLKSDGIVHLEEIEDTPEGIAELKELGSLYHQLSVLKKTKGSTNGKEVATFISNNVEFVTNETLFKSQTLEASNKSAEFKDAWINMAYEKDANGEYKLKDGKYIPNRFLYSYPKPKGKPGNKSYDAWISHEQTEARKLIDKAFKKVPTKYYYAAKRDALKRSQESHDISIYQNWYDANHIYNPYTRQIEPLDCWMMTDYKPEFFKDNELEAKWIPKSTKREKKIRNGEYSVTLNGQEEHVYISDDDKSNRNYDKEAGLLGNYVKGSQGGIYDSNIELNEEEKELRDYVQKLLVDTATTREAKKFFERNYFPQVAKAEKISKQKVAKELGKLIGIGVTQNNGDREFQSEIGYANDKPPVMPMTKLLENKQTIDYQKKLKELEKNKPKEEQFSNHDEYLVKLDEYNELKNKYNEEIKKERNAIRNNDWVTLVESFLEQACRYNAIIDNKQRVYFLQDVLKNMKMYSRKNGMTGDLKVKSKVEDNMDVYDESVDEKLIKVYNNWIQRLLYDQWKEPEGILTQIANILQSYTSADYMMLNFKGGFANITLGETGILAEAAAGEHFGKKEWGKGTLAWAQGAIGFARSGYHSMFYNRDIAFNKQDAIIKMFNVVEYDQVQGVVQDLDINHYSQKLRDLMFSPQSMGEHFMQNSVLFAMMMSHKVVYDEKGKPVAMSKEQYIEFKQAQELLNILDEEQQQKYYEFKENIKKDKNILKRYAWFRRDSITDFIYLHCSKEQIEKFKKDREEQRTKFSEEFDKLENLYDQCELGNDGKMQFVPGSQLDLLDKEMSDNVGEVTKAMALIGEFTMKVKKVNNKIHGVYNRQAAAYIERKWYGSLVMQYHKHLPMGVLKRYMARGHWNETRGSVDKGMIQSIADVANLNLRKIRIENGLTDEEVGTLEGFIYTITHLFDYFQQLKETMAIIPNYEKANLLRNTGDAFGVVSALAMTAALWYIADKDEEVEDSLMFNFLLYQSDRLASEAFLYNPLGLFNEGKKLMSTPVAAQSIVNDAVNTLSAISNWLTDDEYDPYYHSGRFAGEHKLSVYIQRRTPIWNGIRGIIDLPENNHYYKLGANPIGLINVKNLVTED